MRSTASATPWWRSHADRAPHSACIVSVRRSGELEVADEVGLALDDVYVVLYRQQYYEYSTE